MAHLFRDCELARRIWDGSSLGIRTESNIGLPIQDWIINWIKYLESLNDTGKEVTAFISVIWTIWILRNEIFFNHSDFSLQHFFRLQVKTLDSVLKAFEDNTSSHNSSLDRIMDASATLKERVDCRDLSFVEMSSYMSRLFPRSNSSYLLMSGKALQSEVLRLNKEMFSVDTGLGNPRICLKDELTRVPNDPKITRFNNKVGFLDMVAGETNVQKHILERFFIDLMTGDSRIKERAVGKLNDLVGPCTDAVPGEPLLLLPMRFRQKLAGMELKKMQQRGGTVNGFVVHKVWGGYAIAVAGFVAFLPGRSAWSFPRTLIQCNYVWYIANDEAMLLLDADSLAVILVVAFDDKSQNATLHGNAAPEMLGLVERTERFDGVVSRAAVLQVRRCWEPSTVEAKAALLGLQIAKQMGLDAIILESYPLNIISFLKKGVLQHNHMGNVVRGIPCIANEITDVEYSFVLRICNRDVHTMEFSLPIDYCTRVWVDMCPESISDIVSSDVRMDSDYQ
ncbi:hypothetical protein KSS87_001484 [Heliosperma pusillum]|nr:hypothetical protein KSS87_001484 [Heliosperma pusillum]